MIIVIILHVMLFDNMLRMNSTIAFCKIINDPISIWVLSNIFLPSIIPENVLYFYSRVFKGVHLKRAISSEQWTHELLKPEKFHSWKLLTIEWIAMAIYAWYLRSHSKSTVWIMTKGFLVANVLNKCLRLH